MAHGAVALKLSHFDAEGSGLTTEELQEMPTTKFSPEYPESLLEERLKKLPEKLRSEIMSRRKLRFCLEDFDNRKICHRCWTKQFKCICGTVKQTNVRHNIMIYMHYKEYGRQTNTGKILGICCPHSQMYISGIQEQEQAMIAKLRENPETSIVLFPSRDSVSVEQYLSKFSPTHNAEGKGKEREQPDVKEVTTALESLRVRDFPPLNIVIIDGTWNQAKHLVYNIPEDIPRVHINPDSPSLFLLRKQSREDRICTLEASSLLLYGLEQDLGLFETLIDNLKLSVDSVLKDRGLKAAYGKIEDSVSKREGKRLRFQQDGKGKPRRIPGQEETPSGKRPEDEESSGNHEQT